MNYAGGGRMGGQSMLRKMFLYESIFFITLILLHIQSGGMLRKMFLYEFNFFFPLMNYAGGWRMRGQSMLRKMFLQFNKFFFPLH